MGDAQWLELAAQYLEFALYAEGAARLRALAHAPIFCNEAAWEVIARYSMLLEEAWAADEVNLDEMETLRQEALWELRNEQWTDWTHSEDANKRTKRNP